MRGFVRFVFWLAVILAAIFYLGGGWYFSEQLIADGFTVDAGEVERTSMVVAAGDGTASIEAGEDDEEAARPGVFGLDWEDGYARVGEILDTEAAVVTRRVESDADGVPPLGTAVDVDGYAFPDVLPTGWETVTVEGEMGPLEAWEADGSNDTWVIHVHGKGAERREALRAATALAAAGYPQLVITYRNDTGAAPDPSGYYQYGITEWRDLQAAVDLALDSGAGDVVLYGYSTGAAVAMAYLDRVRDAPVIGAVFDAPNVDFATTVDHNAAQRDIPVLGWKVPGSLAWTARTITALRIDIDWDAIDYIDRADRLEVPVLVFHGTDDSTVPVESSRRLAEASDLVELVEVDGAEHVQSWNVDPAAYESRLVDAVAAMETAPPA